MLKIRLARAGRHKTPFFRIVLTEHTRPVQSGYQEMLGWYDPLKHVVNIDVETTKAWVAKWATPTSRVAKILHGHTGDDFFKKYIVVTERVRRGKNAPEEEVAPAAPAPEAKAPAAAPQQEELVAETPAEAPAPEVAPQQEAAPEQQAEQAQEETQQDAAQQEQAEEAK